MPPNFRCVATLPCDLSLITITVSDCCYRFLVLLLHKAACEVWWIHDNCRPTTNLGPITESVGENRIRWSHKQEFSVFLLYGTQCILAYRMSYNFMFHQLYSTQYTDDCGSGYILLTAVAGVDVCSWNLLVVVVRSVIVDVRRHMNGVVVHRDCNLLRQEIESLCCLLYTSDAADE